MSMMKAAAKQSSSVGMAKIMAHEGLRGRNSDFRRRSENDLAPIADL
jgi:hypothetical protein